MMQAGTPQSNAIEREFVSAGGAESAGKTRELPVVTAMPLPPLEMGDSTRVERLIFDARPE